MAARHAGQRGPRMASVRSRFQIGRFSWRLKWTAWVRKKPKLTASVASVLLVLGISAFLLHWFGSFSTGTAVLGTGVQPLKTDDQIYVLVDRPSVPLALEVKFDDADSRRREIQLTIKEGEELLEDEIPYQIYVKGTSFEENSPYKLDQQGECLFRFYVTPAEKVTCKKVRITEDSIVLAGDNDWQVIEGILKRNENGAMWSSIYITPAGHAWSKVDGKRTVFALPEVGTVPKISALPVEYPRVTTSDGEELFPPSLWTIVYYRELEINEEIRTIKPLPVSSDTLLWSSEMGGSIAGRGVIDEIFEEERQDLSYLLFGTAVGFLPGILFGSYRKFVLFLERNSSK